ncbi:MAG: nitrite reductase small subunit NirD [Acidimicrobiia bacterium]
MTLLEPGLRGPNATAATWSGVCAFDELLPERGVCALVGGEQVAIFLVGSELFALSNHDPFSRANVLSRGIVGSKGELLKVASPVYKQNFDLRTGVCLDDPDVVVPTYPVRALDGRVEVALPG